MGELYAGLQRCQLSSNYTGGMSKADTCSANLAITARNGPLSGGGMCRQFILGVGGGQILALLRISSNTLAIF